MSLPSLNIDDRDFEALVSDALHKIKQSCPQWTDLSSGDPGRMLIEVFAFITESLIYRVNKIPDKAFVEFLRLLGVKLNPPKAARTTLKFTIPSPLNRNLDIPKYTRVTHNRAGTDTEPPVFITMHNSTINAGETECTVEAVHAEMVEGELAGRGSGLPGQSVKTAKAPLVADIKLIVGVEINQDELTERVRTVTFNNMIFRIWEEVESFANPPEDRHTFIADRVTGIITFAPALHFVSDPTDEERLARPLGEFIPAGREIRLWYARGGGNTGNVGVNQLTVIKDQVPGAHLSVTNINPATGGSPIETMENALSRGPLQFRSLERAVTADDIELIAKQISGDICRAHAYTKAQVWKHALRGTVEVLVVPSIPESLWNNGHISLETIQNQQKPDASERIRTELEKRTTLGITVSVEWVKYKKVRVSARVIVNSEAKVQEIKERIINRLHNVINPVPTSFNSKGWEMNSPLRISNVYDILLAETSAKYADRVKLIVDHAPSTDVKCIRSDAHQDNLWYASSGSSLFRTSNNGEGWELIHTFGSEVIRTIECSQGYPGLVAVCTESGSEHTQSRIYLSADCGESGKWRLLHQTAFEVEDMAWNERDEEAYLLLAAESGLFELPLKEGAVPNHLLVDSDDPGRGFYAVDAVKDVRGIPYVAVASKRNGGVFISDRQGRAGTYSFSGLRGEDIRLLRMNQYGGRVFLWAGVTVAGTETGKGCYRLELRSGAGSQNSWFHFGKDWSGGSCFSLCFMKETVFAGSHNGGVLTLESGSSDASWRKHAIDSGLPFRDRERIFEPVLALETDIKRNTLLLLAGGEKGVYISTDGKNYANCSRTEFNERVTIPENWLFCSADHEIEVETEDEAV